MQIYLLCISYKFLIAHYLILLLFTALHLLPGNGLWSLLEAFI